MNIGIFRAHLVVLQWNVKNVKNVSISENSVFDGDFCAFGSNRNFPTKYRYRTYLESHIRNNFTCAKYHNFFKIFLINIF